MIRLLVVLVLSDFSVQAQTIIENFGTGPNSFAIEFVEIGNPGNLADTTGSPNPAGSVGYKYNMGKYEINLEQILKTNAAAGLGITFYDPLGFTPVYRRVAVGISWHEAAKFVNWLNTSSGAAPAYNLDENGELKLWTPVDAGFQVNNPFRSKLAKFWLPSTDEWYKAAYGSPNGEWYDFPTGSNTPPISVSSGTDSGTAIWRSGNLALFDDAGGLSPYGTMAQGGNAWELIETAFDGNNNIASEDRELRGDSYMTNPIGPEPEYNGMNSLERFSLSTTGDGSMNIGFRVAMIPEPSSLSLLLAGGAVLMTGRRRKRD